MEWFVYDKDVRHERVKAILSYSITFNDNLKYMDFHLSVAVCTLHIFRSLLA